MGNIGKEGATKKFSLQLFSAKFSALKIIKNHSLILGFNFLIQKEFVKLQAFPEKSFMESIMPVS